MDNGRGVEKNWDQRIEGSRAFASELREASVDNLKFSLKHPLTVRAGFDG
jgi:hypothetical protein